MHFTPSKFSITSKSGSSTFKSCNLHALLLQICQFSTQNKVVFWVQLTARVWIASFESVSPIFRIDYYISTTTKIEKVTTNSELCTFIQQIKGHQLEWFFVFTLFPFFFFFISTRIYNILHMLTHLSVANLKHT